MEQQSQPSLPSRRTFLGWSGKVAAGSALLGAAGPLAHAGENNTIKVALVGCGGRGTGAAANALMVQNGPIKLVALADVFAARVKRSYDNLSKRRRRQLDIPNRFASYR